MSAKRRRRFETKEQAVDWIWRHCRRVILDESTIVVTDESEVGLAGWGAIDYLRNRCGFIVRLSSGADGAREKWDFKRSALRVRRGDVTYILAGLEAFEHRRRAA